MDKWWRDCKPVPPPPLPDARTTVVRSPCLSGSGMLRWYGARLAAATRVGYDAFVTRLSTERLNGLLRSDQSEAQFDKFAIQLWLDDGSGPDPITVLRDATFYADGGRGVTLNDRDLAYWLERVFKNGIRFATSRRTGSAATQVRKEELVAQVREMVRFAEAHHDVRERTYLQLLKCAGLLRTATGIHEIIYMVQYIDEEGPARGVALARTHIEEASRALTDAVGVAIEVRERLSGTLLALMKKHGMEHSPESVTGVHCLIASSDFERLLRAHAQVLEEGTVRLGELYYYRVGIAIQDARNRKRWVKEMGRLKVTLPVGYYGLYFDTEDDPARLKMLIDTALAQGRRPSAQTLTAAVTAVQRVGGDQAAVDFFLRRVQANPQLRNGFRSRSIVVEAAGRLVAAGRLRDRQALPELFRHCQGQPELTRAMQALIDNNTAPPQQAPQARSPHRASAA